MVLKTNNIMTRRQVATASLIAKKPEKKATRPRGVTRGVSCSSQPTVDPKVYADWDTFVKKETFKTEKRIHQAVKDLQGKGIIDTNGRLLNPELPPDMKSGSKSNPAW